MRRIISILMIARLIQRLINGSRRSGGYRQRRFDEPGQGSGRQERSSGPGRSASEHEPIEGSVVKRDSEHKD